MSAPDDFSEIVIAATRRPEALAATRALVARAEAEVARISPRCELSGRCCRFEEYGHRLYITALEMALFVEDLRAAGGSPAAGSGGDAELSGSALPDPGGCPYQKGKLCGVHPVRPLGCRMFFCDPAAAPVLEEAFGRLHGEPKRLHEELGVPYRYVEWRAALAAVGLDPHP